MTIDDAIVAFEQVASGDYDSLELDMCDYERLVKWLTELKLARESAFSDIGLAARAVSENHQLKAENAQLRTQLADATESVGRIEERCAELRNENAKLFKKIHDLENDVWGEGFRDGCEAVNIVTREGHKVYTDEIAELRESLCDIADHIKSDDGYGIDRGWVLERIRETGIEVPE